MSNKKIVGQKIETTEEFAKKIQECKSIIVFEYLGLTVAEINTLRMELHKVDASLHIIKNNILNRALASTTAKDIEGLPQMAGPNALVICDGDEVAPFKIVNELTKKQPKVIYKFGILEHRIVGIDNLQTVSSIPNREGLYSMLLSCLQGPIRNFLYGLKAVSEQKN